MQRNAGKRMKSSWPRRKLLNGLVEQVASTRLHCATILIFSILLDYDLIWLSGQSCNIYLQFLAHRSIRRLCAKLFLKGETQQVDRILEEFSRRYWECNPAGIYGSASALNFHLSGIPLTKMCRSRACCLLLTTASQY